MQKFSFLFSLIFFSITAFAQVDYSNPKEYEIADIEVSGIRFLSQDALIILSGLSVGQKIEIPGDDISNSIKKLWDEGMFSDVQIFYNKVDANSVKINILLQEQPRLHKIIYLGDGRKFGKRRKAKNDSNSNTNTFNSHHTDLVDENGDVIVSAQDLADIEAASNDNTAKKDIEEELASIISTGKMLTDNLLSQAENKIKDYYAEKGFPNTVVTYTVKNDTTLQNWVNLYVHIDKKNKVKIEELIIRGNTAFSDNKIKRTLKETKQRNFWRVWKTSKYISDNFKNDQKELIKKYNKAGYRDARIVEDSVYTVSGQLNVYLKIHEGNKYHYRSIKWVGNTIYTTDQLNKILDIKPGDVYNPERLENRLVMAEDAVGNLYLDNGYLFYQSIPREVSVANDSVDLEIIIMEGEQARINKVLLEGNTRTNDHVARREIRTLPGELFSKSDIIRSSRELAQIGNFDPEQLVPMPIPNQAEGNTDIKYSVVEKSNDMFELSGGWGMIGFIGRVGVRFNNFSTQNILKPKTWAPLPIGDGQQLSISANIGASQYQLYSISFMEPWLGGKKPNSLSVSVYYNLMSNGVLTKYEDPTTNYLRQTMQLYGASVGLGRRLKVPDDYFVLSNELSFQRYYIDGLTSYIDVADGAYNILSLNTTLARNSIDNPLYTRHGSNISASLKFTPPYSIFMGNKNWASLPEQEKFRWVELYKVSIKGDWYFSIVGDLVFRTAFEYGFLGSYNRNIGYSPFEGYELGGDGMGYYTFGKDYIGLRGYENQSLTATQGAHIYTKYTAELRHPIILKEIATIYALTFLEAGNSWSYMNESNPFDIYRSAGAGVRVFLPMLGQIGVDFGYGFDDVPNKPGVNGFQYHFVFGQQF